MEKIRGSIISYLIIVAVIFWPILWPPEGTLVFGDDIHRSYHFFRQLFGDAIARGEFPWWNPYLFSGEPLIANPSLAFWYPVNWLFAVLPYRFVYSWIIPIHIFWAMLGMYVLLHALSSRPLSRDPVQINVDFGVRRNDNFAVGPWIGGLVFGLSGFFMGRVWEGHIELITSASWMPWVFGAFWQLLQDHRTNFRHGWNLCGSINRRVVVAGGLFAIQLLAGYQTMALFTLEAVFIVSLFHCLPRYTALRAVIEQIPKARSKVLWGFIVRSLKPVIRVLLAVLIGLGLAGIQIIPVQEFFSRSIRTYALPYSWAVFGSYTLDNLKQLIDPFILGTPWAYRGPSPNFGEMAAYVGRLPILLALLALLLRRSWRTVALAAVAAFGLWVSFGWNAPIDLNKILWDAVPTYKYLRIPSRHLILFVFGASALAGIGLSLARHSLLRLVIAAVITVDMVWFARHVVALKPDPVTRHNRELVAYLQTNSGLTRILPNFNVGMGTRDALDFDAVMGYRLFSASGYDPAILRNYYEFAAAAGGIEKPDVQTSDVQIPYLTPASPYTDFLNVKHVFVPSWFDSVAGSSSKFRLVMEENAKDYFRLYENIRVLPRFFLVPTMVGLPDRDRIARAIRQGEYDPDSAVLVQQKDIPSGFTADCGERGLPSVVVQSYSMNTITLTTDAPCHSFLATSEVMYPGWTATIDGKPAPLLEGNLAFRTLPVPAGRHTITMAYQPRIFLIGAGLSLVTAALCILWTKLTV